MPADQGDSGRADPARLQAPPEFDRGLRSRGVPGVFLDLSPTSGRRAVRQLLRAGWLGAALLALPRPRLRRHQLHLTGYGGEQC